MLNQSEAVLGFASWLSVLDKTLVVGEGCDPNRLLDLVCLFCSTNGFPPPRDTYRANLLIPNSGDAYKEGSHTTKGKQLPS